MKLNMTILALILTASAASSTLAGPPNICHPVLIGDATSLPFGGPDAPFEKGGLAVEEVPGRTLEILDQSDSVLVHMETIRRAWVYLWHDRDQRQLKLSARLYDRLKDRALAAEARDNALSSSERALRWFDLGHFVSVFEEGGMSIDVKPKAYLLKAARLDPDNAALQFGIAQGRFMEDTRGKSTWYHHMHQAARLIAQSAGDDVLLQKNMRRSLKNWDRKVLADDFTTIAANLKKKLVKV